MDNNNTEIDLPYRRGDFLIKANRVTDYMKLKQLYLSVISKIANLEESLKSKIPPRNPRQDILLCQRKNNLRALQNQKIRIEQKMTILEESIKKDMSDIDI